MTGALTRKTGNGFRNLVQLPLPVLVVSLYFAIALLSSDLEAPLSAS